MCIRAQAVAQNERLEERRKTAGLQECTFSPALNPASRCVCVIVMLVLMLVCVHLYLRVCELSCLFSCVCGVVLMCVCVWPGAHVCKCVHLCLRASAHVLVPMSVVMYSCVCVPIPIFVLMCVHALSCLYSCVCGVVLVCVFVCVQAPVYEAPRAAHC